MSPAFGLRLSALLAALVVVAAACGDGGDTLTVYSGRSEELVGPLIDQFEESTGIDVTVRYAGSTELAATLLEEGDRTPAEVFFAQDPASLGAVAELLEPLPGDVLTAVPERFSDRSGRWVGISGRVRVAVHHDSISAADLPDSVAGFTDPAWEGRLGIAPTNGSFLAFVAAMILADGEESAAAWLEAVAANNPGKYANNSAIVEAVARGEVEVGLVNHYYLLRAEAEQGEVAARNHFLAGDDPGALVMPAGGGVLQTAEHPDEAVEFIRFLLSRQSQEYFAEETFEYPLVESVPPGAGLPPLDSLGGPDISLSDLAGVLDLATDLVAEAGLL